MRALCLICLLPFVVPSARAAESLDTCVGYIPSLPAVITTQGVWCLDKDLATASMSGNAITVSANNVTLDCNGFKLGGLGAGPETLARGIASVSRLNTTVRNCTVRGFNIGVLFFEGSGHLVEDSRIDASTAYGILAQTDTATVRRNIVLDTGNASASNLTTGIYAEGEVHVLDNTVIGVDGNNSATGIGAWNNSGVIADNRVSGVIAGGGDIRGIKAVGGRTIIRDNNVVGDGALNTLGIQCDSNAMTATGNVITGFENNLYGCLDAGNISNANN